MHKYYAGMSDQKILEAFHAHYLKRKGWFASVKVRESVDETGPVPWFTYPAVDYLNRLIRPDWKVFEYGAGGSTGWWAARVAEVVSVEHDSEWAAHVRTLVRGKNCTVISAPEASPERPDSVALLDEFFALEVPPVLTKDEQHNYRSGLLWQPFRAYAGAIGGYQKQSFDVVVVDGMARSLTAWLAAHWVKPDGIVIFDNSDRDTYAPGYDLLHQAGFQRIDFWGPGPINPYEWCTSLFVKSLAALRSK